MNMVIILAVFLCTFFSFSLQEGPLNVHLVCHTHDDVGWLKTIDDYYYGRKMEIHRAGAVESILDTVVSELAQDQKRKFSYAEIAFFAKWWDAQNDTVKQMVHELVQSGQLEFINGGWCSNDEATVHYNAIIDQMSIGLRFISSNFGVQPLVGWQIDPFGHSSFQATAYSLMGFSSGFISRIDFVEKYVRYYTSELEMMWQNSHSLGHSMDLFTAILYPHYIPPPDFCFDELCTDSPIKDIEGAHNNKVNEFISYSLNKGRHFKTNNILLTMGNDFNYGDAGKWYRNLDKLIKYANENGSVNVMYSTPSLYMKYVNQDNKVKWEVKKGDFFPYATAPHHYWSGYLSSRPGLKGYARKCNAHLQACKQLEAIHNGMGDNGPSSVKLQHAVGEVQHHDAITGTEKQHVANDYAKRLHIGEVECRSVMATVLNDLAAKGANAPKMNLSFCEYLNISVCPVTEGGDFNMVVYNSLARPYTGVVHIPVIKEDISVTDPNNNKIPVQVMPISPMTKRTPAFARYNAQAQFHAAIEVTVPPLGYAVYTASTTGSKKHSKFVTKSDPLHVKTKSEDVVISNEFYQVKFDGKSGHIKTITNIASSVSSDVNQQLYWYCGSTGDKEDNQNSGAYVFRPNSSMVFPFGKDNNNNANISVIKGDLLSEVRQVYNPWVSQVVRLYKNKPSIELEYTIGPIDIKDNLGKEVISRFSTNFKTKSTFYTDSNGRETIKRMRDYLPLYPFYKRTEPVAGNYYPITSRAFIRDEDSNLQLTVLTDRAQGGSSLTDGTLELMIHRRLLHDDSRGVFEPLNETGESGDGLVIRGKHLLILDTIDESAYTERMMAEELMMTPELAFAPTDGLQLGDYNLKYSGLSTALPDNVHLLTLEYLDKSTILLRLDHQFESDDPKEWSAPASVKLSDLFVAFKIKEVTELGLGGNVALSDIKRLQWKTIEGQTVPSPMNFPPVTAPDFTVSLSPMMIRTFNVTVEFK